MLEHYPTEYLQHPLPVLALVGLDLTSTIGTNLNPTEEGDPPNHDLGSNRPDEPLTQSSASTCLTQTEYISVISKRIVDLLGVDLPPSVWEPFNRLNLSIPHGVNPPGIANRTSAISTGVNHWVAGSERLFYAVVGDRSCIFPVKRARSVAGVPSTHSVLSPLCPISPLYPDLLMTPVWLRKHLSDLPGAILAFYKPWLPGEAEGYRPNLTANQPVNVAPGPPYRESDAALAAEINEARRSAQENGVKFAAVIWNLPPHDDEVMGDRLTQIRKGSGLDSRGGFFVLDRRGAETLPEFMAGILKALQEPALARYRESYRRAKRKLTRLPTLPPTHRPALSPRGWGVRYEFKLAQFAQIRGEREAAIRHFEGAYCALSELLSDGNTDDHRRWSDASMLIDAISFHIVRLYLYLDNGQAALLQLHRHLRGFGPLWGTDRRGLWVSGVCGPSGLGSALGKGFEFGPRVPPARRAPPAGLFQMGSHTAWRRPTQSASVRGAPSEVASTHPLAVLQHPGYYYYEAARHLTGPEHSPTVIEALSKGYEQFKRHRGDRMTLKVASAIAAAYFRSGKYDLALEFYDRIARAYRKEPWPQLLCAALQQARVCAQRLGLASLPRFAMDLASREAILGQVLETLLGACDPTSDGPRVVEMALDPASSFLSISAAFETSTAILQRPLRLQLSITASLYPSAKLHLSSINVAVSDPALNFILENDPNLPPSALLEAGRAAPLELKHGVPLVLQKLLLIGQVGEVKVNVAVWSDGKVTSVILHLASPYWDLALKHEFRTPLPTGARFGWFTESDGELHHRLSPVGVDPLTTRVLPPPPRLKLQAVGPKPAYVNETCPIDVHVVSEEEVAIEAKLGWEWLTHEPSDQIYAEFPAAAPNPIPVGTLEPGGELTMRIYAAFMARAGARQLNLKVFRARLSELQVTFTRCSSPDRVSEVASLIETEVALPFTCQFKLCPLAGLFPTPPSSLLQRLAPARTLRRRAMLTSHIAPAERCIVHRLELIPSAPDPSSTQVEVLTSELDLVPSEWEARVARLVNHLLEATAPMASASNPHPAWSLQLGHLKVHWQRPDGFTSECLIPIPRLDLPSLHVAVELAFPSLILEGEPFTLTYTLANTTPQTEEVTCRLDASDLPLVCAGWRVTHRRLLPFSINQLTVTCHALAYGRFPAPRLAIERQGIAREGPSPLELTYGWDPEAPCLLVKPHFVPVEPNLTFNTGVPT
ncbi:hypothetical protein L0F63_000853 [Massospora cicadina]|nr:hypothetical protein L0F63_000853 [Massospora cicadina]